MSNAAVGLSESTTDRIAELVEENAYLRRQLALEVDGSVSDALADRYGLTGQEATLLAALMAAGGRTLSKGVLADLLPVRRSEHMDPKFVDVFVHRVRKKAGWASVETVWGRGHRIGKGFREAWLKRAGEVTS